MRAQSTWFQNLKSSIFFVINGLGLFSCSSLTEFKPDVSLQASNFGCPSPGVSIAFPTDDGKGTTKQFGNFIQSVQAFPEGKIEIKLTDEIVYRIYLEQLYVERQMAEETFSLLKKNSKLDEKYYKYEDLAGPGWCMYMQTKTGSDFICREANKEKKKEETGQAKEPSNSFIEQLMTYKWAGKTSGNLLNGSGHFSSSGNEAILYVKNQEGLVVAFVEVNFKSAYDSSVKVGFPETSAQKQAIFEIYPLTIPVDIKTLEKGQEEFNIQKRKEEPSLFGVYSFINYPSAEPSKDLKQFFRNELNTEGFDGSLINKQEKGSYVIGVNREDILLRQTRISGVRHHFYVELRKGKQALGKLHLYRIFSKNFPKVQNSALPQIEPVVLKEGREYYLRLSYDCKDTIESSVLPKVDAANK